MEKAGMMQNNVQIIPVEKKHIPEILQIERASFSMPWSYDSFRHELEDLDSHFTAAICDGQVVGFCVLRRFDIEGEIFNIAVSDAYRGKGIGEQLLSEALSFADVLNVKHIFLEVRRSNIPAISLYKKLGFNILGFRKNYYDAPTEDAIMMRRDYNHSATRKDN